MEENLEKINQKIEHIIACLHQYSSEQHKNNLFRFARQVLSNEVIRQNTDTPQELKQRIIGKIAMTCDQRSTFECQQIIQKFYHNGGITKKQEVLIMLVKLSQLIKPEQLDISRIFHQSKNDHNRTLDASRNGFSYIVSHQMSQQSNEQLLMIKNRGILDGNITAYDLVKQLSYVFTNTATSQIISTEDGYQLRPNLEVSESVREMVNHMADLGWLHKKILSYLNKQGSIRRALCQTVHQQLKQFYIWNRTMQELIKKNELSLRKMYVMSFHPEQILRWLAIILQSVESYNNCHIISIINSFRPHGIEAVDALLNRTLKYIIRPLMNYIHSWIYMGELIDSRSQFFIHEDKKVTYSEEWKKRFKLILEKIPNILNQQSATMIFNTGKTIHFLKNKLKIFYKIKIPFIQLQNYQEFKIQNAKDLISTLFMNWLTEVYKQVNKVLVQTLYNQFHLKYHLQSMRDFFLCGKGDLIQQLYDSMDDILSHNINQVSQHTLDGYISDAITRCYTNFRLPYTNSTFIQSIVSRFLAVKSKIDPKSIYCWQVFNFRYALEGIEPLQTIFTADIIQNYQKIFHFLWKSNKMQENLKYLWTSLNRQESFKVRSLNKKMFIALFHFIYILKNEMIQFIMNLNRYFMIAIDQRWNVFCQDIGKSSNFDEILDKHKEFQLNILKILLITSDQKSIHQSLHRFFDIIDDFKIVCTKLQDIFNDYLFSASSIQRQGDMVHLVQNPTQTSIKKYWEILRKLKANFDEAIKNLCYHLQTQRQSKISNLGVLLARLDFNQYYSNNILQM